MIHKQHDKKWEMMAQCVRPWLEKMNYRPQIFWELKRHNRVLLYRFVCVGDQQASDDAERRDLYRDLRSAEARVKGYSDPVDHLTPQQLVEYFSSETSGDELNDLDKY